MMKSNIWTVEMQGIPSRVFDSKEKAREYINSLPKSARKYYIIVPPADEIISKIPEVYPIGFKETMLKGDI